MIDLFHICRRLLHGIEKVTLKAVEIFNRQLNAGVLRHLGKDAVSLSRVFTFGIRRGITGKISQLLVIGAAEILPPSRCQ